MKQEPLVSFVMPAYNGERFIGKAIQSIQDQTYRNWELVIVDDCGTDHTMDVVRNIYDDRIKILTNENNKGIAFSRNKAIENSKGKYISILDDDDMALPDRLRLQIDYLESHPEIAVVGGRSYWIDENDNIIRSTSSSLTNPQYISAIYLFSGCYINCTCTFRRSIFDDYNVRYQENMLGMEDVLFWIECSKIALMSNVEEFVSLHREHSNRESNKVKIDGGLIRAKKWAEIHDYSLQKSGFVLDNEESIILHHFDPELVCEIPSGSQNELEEYYRVLKKIIAQAERMDLPNKEEIRIACRKRFSRALEYSYLWK